MAFQYSFCSYSTFGVPSRVKPESSFNTASVLIQQNINWEYEGTTHVSIQLLFLFNRNHPFQSSRNALFQYSFCSYSTSQYMDIE